MNVRAMRPPAAASADRDVKRSRGTGRFARVRRGLLAALGLAGLTASGALPAAYADEPPPAAASEVNAADPGGARGYERAPGHAGETAALVVPRLLLLPVRVGLHAVTWPVRLVAGPMSSAGCIEQKVRGLSEERYFVPTAFVDPDPGVNFGFRAAHGSPLDDRGCVTYRAAWGGTKRQVYALTLRSRDLRQAGWTYRLTGKWEVIPDHNYFGLGNNSSYNARSYYTAEKYLLLAKFGRPVSPTVRLDLTLSHHRSLISRAAYVEPPEKSIEERFPTEQSAPGWRNDPQNYWAELALTWDRRDRPGLTTAGWLAETYAGYAKGAALDAADYWRYGAEVSGYLPLGRGRVLAVRAVGEEARTSGDVPIKITELISLGGRSSLRGYVEDRFLDNAAVMWTAEYRYRVAPFAEACLFADFGKVMPRLLDFDLDDIHRSFGGGLQFATAERLLFRLQFARSDETYVFFGTLEPVFEREDRRDRR